MIELAVGVGVFHILSLNVSGGELGGGVVGLFYNGACDNVSHLCSYERRALTGLNVLELDDLHYIAVFLECHAISEISCCDHSREPPNFISLCGAVQ